MEIGLPSNAGGLDRAMMARRPTYDSARMVKARIMERKRTGANGTRERILLDEGDSLG
jgi:hypothetical protein